MYHTQYLKVYTNAPGYVAKRYNSMQTMDRFNYIKKIQKISYRVLILPEVNAYIVEKNL